MAWPDATRRAGSLGLVLILLPLAGACSGPGDPSVGAISAFSLGIEPLNGFGYRVTFVSGGGATDVRSRDLAADVECVGSVTQADYEATADLIVTEGLLELGPQYGFHPDYPPTVFTTATRDGNETTVRNYPGAAPAALVRIQQAIRGLRERVAWSAKSAQPLDQRLCSVGFFFGEPR